MKLSKSLVDAMSMCPVLRAVLGESPEPDPDYMPCQAADAVLEDHPFARFLAEVCEVRRNRSTRVADLCARVAVWWEDRYPDLRAPRPQEVGKMVALFASGVKVRRNHRDGRFYVGLGIKPCPSPTFGQCEPNMN